MNNKKCLVLLVPLLVTACNVNTTSASLSSSVMSSSSSSESSAETSSSYNNTSSVKTETPYLYELKEFDLPETNSNKSHELGQAFNITWCEPFESGYEFVERYQVFDSDWLDEQRGARSFEYADVSNNHKPAFLLNSYLFNEVDDIGDYTNNINYRSNLRIPLNRFKSYPASIIRSNKNNGETTLFYTCGVECIYYSKSLGNITTLKKDFTDHLTAEFIDRVNKVCTKNEDKEYFNFFHDYGTHIMWSCYYGTSLSLEYEVRSSITDLTKLDNSHIKYLFDTAVLAGVNSKTYEEYQEKVDVSVGKVVGSDEGIFDLFTGLSVVGSMDAFLEKAVVPGNFGSIAAKVAALPVENAPKEATYLQQTESYAIWEFLPQSMNEQRAALSKAYNDYLTHQADSFAIN